MNTLSPAPAERVEKPPTKLLGVRQHEQERACRRAAKTKPSGGGRSPHNSAHRKPRQVEPGRRRVSVDDKVDELADHRQQFEIDNHESSRSCEHNHSYEEFAHSAEEASLGRLGAGRPKRGLFRKHFSRARRLLIFPEKAARFFPRFEFLVSLRYEAAR